MYSAAKHVGLHGIHANNNAGSYAQSKYVDTDACVTTIEIINGCPAYISVEC